jgi:hypothetical protein
MSGLMLMPSFTYGEAILIRTPLAEVSGLHLYISRHFHGTLLVVGFGDGFGYESSLSARNGSSFILHSFVRVEGSL